MCRELTEDGRNLTQDQPPPLSDAVGADVGALAELQARHCSVYNVGSYFSMLTKFMGQTKASFPA